MSTSTIGFGYWATRIWATRIWATRIWATRIWATRIWAITLCPIVIFGDSRFAARRPEIGVDHSRMGANVLGRPFGNDFPGCKTHDPITDPHDDVHIVFDQYDRHAVIGDAPNMLQ